MVSKPITTDPRAELIDWEILSSESFPPIEEWDESHWDDAALATLVHHHLEKEKLSGQEQRTISFDAVLAKRGLTLDDLK